MNLSGVSRSGGKKRPEFWVEPVIFIGLVAITWFFLRDSFLMDLFIMIGLTAIASTGLNLLVGSSGQLSIGQNAFMALGAYTTGILTSRYGWPVEAGVLIALAVSGGAALLLGIALTRLQGLYLAVATLAFGSIVYSLISALYDLTGGGAGLMGIPPVSVMGRSLSPAGYFLVVWIIVGLLTLVTRNLNASRVGLALRAIKGDQAAAESAGINLARFKTEALVISGLMGSLGGSLMSHHVRFIVPDLFNLKLAIDLLLMVYLGGVGTTWGAVIGATFIGVLPHLIGFTNQYKPMVYGLFFAVVLVFLPKGIAGLVGRVMSLIKSSGKQKSANSISRPLNAGNYLSAERVVPIFQTVERFKGPKLKVSDLSVNFGGLLAVDKVSFEIKTGSVTALVGPNGAGKTTVFNMICGFLRPSGGSIAFSGQGLIGLRPDQSAQLGIQRTFQVPRMFDSMTVLENVMVGRHCRTKSNTISGMLRLPGVVSEERRSEEIALTFLELVNCQDVMECVGRELPTPRQRMVELARALAGEPTLILMDEPAAGLNETETDALANIILKLKTWGLTIILVEHDMRFIRNIADQVIVLNQGRLIAQGKPPEVLANPEVVTAYLGRGLGHYETEVTSCEGL